MTITAPAPKTSYTNRKDPAPMTTATDTGDVVNLSVDDARTVLDTLTRQHREWGWLKRDKRTDTFATIDDLRRSLDYTNGDGTIRVRTETAWWAWHLDGSTTLYDLDGAEASTYEHPAVAAWLRIGEPVFAKDTAAGALGQALMDLDMSTWIDGDESDDAIPPDGLYALLNPLDNNELTFWRAGTDRRKGHHWDMRPDRRTWKPWPPEARYTARPGATGPTNRLWTKAVRLAIVKDPLSAGAHFAAIHNSCFRCKKALRDAKSKTYGIGPDCREFFTAGDLARCAAATRRWLVERDRPAEAPIEAA